MAPWDEDGDEGGERRVKERKYYYFSHLTLCVTEQNKASLAFTYNYIEDGLYVIQHRSNCEERTNANYYSSDDAGNVEVVELGEVI